MPPVDLSKALIEKENADALKMVREHQQRIRKVVEDIDKILIENNITWRDWGEVIQVFNGRNQSYFNNVLISTINSKEYVNAKPSPRGEIVQ